MRMTRVPAYASAMLLCAVLAGCGGGGTIGGGASGSGVSAGNTAGATSSSATRTTTRASSGGSSSDGSSSDGSSSVPSFPATLTTRKIISFDQTAGQSQWVASAQNRIAKGRWRFDSSGRVTFSTVDVRDDVYPLHGSYRRSGSTVTFSVKGSSSSSNGSAQASMDGEVDFAQSPPVMSVTWLSGSVLAAHVNDTSYGTNTSAGYDVTTAVSVS